ncbi:MAG TPA: class I mannose-6-phosphate isomerase [Mucilaginibacter sp.]|nr:class I mannose-6-phosphate isomerase [Mucilaginibacter sp.]
MNLNLTNNDALINEPELAQLRKSPQFIMPARINEDAITEGTYNVFPFCRLGQGKIFNGYESLVKWITEQKTVIIDGYQGLFWDRIEAIINQLMVNEGLTVNWIRTADFLKKPAEVNELVAPFLGTADSVWGTKCQLKLSDLYNMDVLTAQRPASNSVVNIVIGPAAALTGWDAPIVYIDLPKNELQYRMRAGSIVNLGSDTTDENFLMYKRFYFVDWVLLNEHKKQILDKIAIIADGQWTSEINWMLKADFAAGLNKVSQSFFRVRPWFDPGAWGGQWIKEHIPNLSSDVVNYAWSFELIVPENGLVFESNGLLLEVTFDFLMFHNREQVLGKHATQFGDEFPIRFDFLDTYDGGNLSIQCHPQLDYIRKVFGETITQDETYYILDCKDDATVYLGFQENIDPEKFQKELTNSQNNNVPVEIEDFVQKHTAKKHDLFLIPNGTVHSAGANNLVLEISATPYIFTFKMYDWLRLDLDGNPRPINIDHAFKNLNFDRKGDRVKNELISQPRVLEQDAEKTLVHLPTHADHFYDVHRIEFDREATMQTENCCHVMMLVEGESVLLETADGASQVFAFAETFVIPAAAKSYRLKNLGKSRAKVIKAFLK